MKTSETPKTDKMSYKSKVVGSMFIVLIMAVLFALIESDAIRLIIIVSIPVITLSALYDLAQKEKN